MPAGPDLRFDELLGAGRGSPGAAELAQARRSAAMRRLLAHEGFRLRRAINPADDTLWADACARMQCPACGAFGLSYEPYRDAQGGFTCLSACPRCAQLTETAAGQPLALDAAVDTAAPLPEHPDAAKVRNCPGNPDIPELGCDERFLLGRGGSIELLNLAGRRTGQVLPQCPTCGAFAEDVVG